MTKAREGVVHQTIIGRYGFSFFNYLKFTAMSFLESVDWMTVAPGILAIAIFVGGMLMMFTGVWTSRNR